MLRYLPQRLVLFLCLCGIVSSADSSGVWLDVPFIQQQKDGCGAAVIAMVMDYWKAAKPELRLGPVKAAEIQRELFSRPEHGIYASDLQKYFEGHGFLVFTFRGDWDLLRSHLEKGRPLIVALRPNQGEISSHYVVIAGLDWQNDLVMVNDPAQKKLLKVDRKQFEHEWTKVHRWTLLAVPRR
jgi:ABC-type bacteriocin/lantibiotic exporter with double-glycine peptidase domain